MNEKQIKNKVNKYKEQIKLMKEDLAKLKTKRDNAKTDATWEKYDTLYTKQKQAIVKVKAKMEEFVAQKPVEKAKKEVNKETPKVEKEKEKKNIGYTVWYNKEFNKSIGGFFCGKVRDNQKKPDNVTILAKGLDVNKANELVSKINDCASNEELHKVIVDYTKNRKDKKIITPLTTKVQKKLNNKDMEDVLKPTVKKMENVADKRNTANAKVKNMLKDINGEIRSIKNDTEKNNYYKNPDNIEDLIARLELLHKQVLKYNQQSGIKEDDLEKFSNIVKRAERVHNFSMEA